MASKEKEFRSTCLIASALDLIGDKWSLLLVRDMLLFRKKTYKEFIDSDEGIATNLLSSRLKLLESLEILTKRKLPGNKKENIYLLTPKGVDLAPIIMELVLWSDLYVREYHPDLNPHDVEGFDKKTTIALVKKQYDKFVKDLVG